MVLRAQDRFNEAIRAYDAVLTLNRNFVPAYANIAYAKLSAGSTEDAIPLLEEAIRLSPRNSDVGSWYWASASDGGARRSSGFLARKGA
jgi:tetratricopeptide (TPR) repeat protein